MNCHFDWPDGQLKHDKPGIAFLLFLKNLWTICGLKILETASDSSSCHFFTLGISSGSDASKKTFNVFHHRKLFCFCFLQSHSFFSCFYLLHRICLASCSWAAVDCRFNICPTNTKITTPTNISVHRLTMQVQCIQQRVLKFSALGLGLISGATLIGSSWDSV